MRSFPVPYVSHKGWDKCAALMRKKCALFPLPKIPTHEITELVKEIRGAQFPMGGLSRLLFTIQREWICVRLKFARFSNRVHAYHSEISSVLEIVFICGIFIYLGFVFWIFLMYLDIAAGTYYFEFIMNIMHGLRRFLLPVLHVWIGLLEIFMAFSMLLQQCYDYRRGYKERRISKWPIMRRLPKIEFGKMDSRDVTMTECVICLESIGVRDSVHVLPSCKHYFHVACIDRWFSLNNRCPICRSGV